MVKLIFLLLLYNKNIITKAKPNLEKSKKNEIYH